MNCKNCDTPITGSFCHHCGQKANTHRINFHEIAHDFVHSVWHIDKGFGYTFLSLIKSPRSSIRGYLEGKRIKFFRPFSYLLITSAITLLVANLMVSMTAKGEGSAQVEHLRDELNKENAAVSPSAETEKPSVGRKIGFFLHKTAKKYLGFLLFGLVPVLALFSFILFKEAKLNYWEHLTAYTYITSQLNIVILLLTVLNIGSSPFIDIKNHWFSLSMTLDFGLVLVLLILTLYTYQVFHQKNKILAAVKAVFLPIFSLITAITILGIFL